MLVLDGLIVVDIITDTLAFALLTYLHDVAPQSASAADIGLLVRYHPPLANLDLSLHLIMCLTSTQLAGHMRAK